MHQDNRRRNPHEPDELSKKELLEWLDKCWSLYRTSQDEWKLAQQAYRQIKQIIQKPQVTEEWIEYEE